MVIRGCGVMLLIVSVAVAPDVETKADGPGRLPVREVTVFKDGHAFVVREGRRPVDAKGRVQLDDLPVPVLGTFWAYSREEGVSLSSVTAGRQAVRIERTALTVPDLLEANVGKRVIVGEGERTYEATIEGFLTRTSAEVEATSLPNVTSFPAQRSNLVLLKTADGVRVVPVERITDVKFPGEYGTRLAAEEERNLLTLDLKWPNGKPGDSAEVGMAYVQRGVRWIPGYRIELDGNGKAKVLLQATLLNELADLENATVHLVIGVPAFEFKETTDPISLGQTMAQLSSYFEQGSSTNYGLSNSIMTQQVARMREVRRPTVEAPAATVDLGPEIAGSEKNEDLFVFTVPNITLKRGERMVLPVAEQVLSYEDVFVLDIPYSPPREIEANLNDERQQNLSRLLKAPKATHNVRLTNTSKLPLTTAPALLLREGRVLSQGMTTYTSPGATSDITLTTAVDIKVRKSESETKRTPDAARWHSTHLQRVDLAGTLSLTNLRDRPVRLEVVRHVLGKVDEVGQDGRSEMINALEDDEFGIRPPWWPWYHWPAWWSHHNGFGRFSWSVTLAPGKSADLTYAWHYFAP